MEYITLNWVVIVCKMVELILIEGEYNLWIS